MSPREIRVASFHFWKDFQPETLNARFPCVARKYRIVPDQKRPDIVFFSVFKNRRWDLMPKAPDMGVPTIFLTGENVVPDMNNCDAAISFSRDIDSARHLRMPNWVQRLNFNGISPRTLLSAERRRIDRGDRFCLFLYRHRVAFREEFCRRLSARKSVDAPGLSLNNMPAIGNDTTDKLALQERYRFTIAFENTASSGYTTEKLVESFCAGSLPIYWGDPQVSLDFNRDAFLNLADFPSQDALADAVMALEDDERAWRDMMQRAVFADDVLPACADDDRIFAFLEPIFDAALRPSRRCKAQLGHMLRDVKQRLRPRLASA